LNPRPDPKLGGQSPRRVQPAVAPTSPRRRVRRSARRLRLVLAFLAIAGLPWVAHAEDEPTARERRGASDEQVFDFTGLEIGGRLRTPQLLYFLDRAREELRQASLERRSFLPEMVRSIDEESL
jgi:hypothetical protein